MKVPTFIIVLAAAAAIGAGFGLYRLGLEQGARNGTASTATDSAAAPTPIMKAGQVDPSNGKKVLYWHDPMVPGQKFDKPGKSPFMDMQLVPVYADEGGSDTSVSISPRVQQNLGVRVAEVKRGESAMSLEAVGSVAYNERDVAMVQARSNGFVERLFVRAPLDPVKRGQPLAELYVPDWVAAQEEYLTVRRIEARATPNGNSLEEGARQRMRLAGMTDEQIRAVAAGGKVQPRLTIVAPIGGVVGELNAREGMTIMAGAPLFRLNGLSTVWVNAEVPENFAAQIKPGTAVEARTQAIPDVVFKGKISAILPEVNSATRTIKARIELANPSGRLVPGMFATVRFAPSTRNDLLLIPTEAVIQTGTRSVVIVAQDDGRFTPVDVEIGTESNGQTEIRKGLEAGQKVVVSGQFLIDSEASLRATANRMGDMPKGPAASVTHHGEGKVESIGKQEVTISHGPIPSLQWGAMTMDFKLPSTGLPQGIKVGDAVAFDIQAAPDGTYAIASIAPATASSSAAAPGKAKGAIGQMAPSTSSAGRP